MLMKLDLYIRLKYESSTIMRELLSDLSNCAWPAS